VSRRLAAIVDPYASGMHLAGELARLDVDCLAVQSQPLVPEVFRSSFRPEDFVDTLLHTGDPASTSARLAEREVALVIAGCELGVELADALSEALGLPGNGPARREARRHKGRMADAFREAGLRTPEQVCSDRLEVVSKFAASRGGPVVLKPSSSSSSDGVALCRDEAEVARAFDAIVGHENVLGLTNREVVAQEYMSGPEYVVDTVSIEGRHRPVAFWRYHESSSGETSLGYEGMELLPGSGAVQDRLLEEARAGLDALEIRVGPGHSELIWTEAGPVVLEIGARLHGGENPRLAGLCGARSHIAETARAYAAPSHFAEREAPGYALTRHCTVAFLLPRASGILSALPRLPEVEALESLHQIEIGDCLGIPAPRVIGWVALVHPEKDRVDRDLAELRRLETEGLYAIDPA
jgi:hypothetical protein